MDQCKFSEIAERRRFLTSFAQGIGGAALASLLRNDGVLSAAAPNPPNQRLTLTPRPPHFGGTAKNCIFLFMGGGVSQVDLFDPKPKLNEMHGQSLPDSMLRDVDFFAVNKYTAKLLGSPQKFAPRGQCGTQISDLLPQLGALADDFALIRTLVSENFNHSPAMYMLSSGASKLGSPALGAWLLYGLGSESQNLPAYVVLTAGQKEPCGGAGTWSSGFLPGAYQGIRFRNGEMPIVNVTPPKGVTNEVQRATVDLVKRLNQHRSEHVHDPEIDTRIAAYELAFRMQAAAPDLTDFSGETRGTEDAYGIHRKGLNEQTFSMHCLFARRMVERGVRFVDIWFNEWDHHKNINPKNGDSARVVDQPIAALLNDLKQRGLFESTLVVWASEFGRTPLNEGDLKAASGRDHHPHTQSVWLAGGGTQGGQVIGKTDDVGFHPIDDKVSINDLHATILYLFGIDHEQLTYRFQGRDMRLTGESGAVITKLVG